MTHNKSFAEALQKKLSARDRRYLKYEFQKLENTDQKGEAADGEGSAAIFKRGPREGILLTYNKDIILCCSCGTQDAACSLLFPTLFVLYSSVGPRNKGAGNFAKP